MEGGFLPERGFLVRIIHYETQLVRSHVQVILCSRTEYNLECCNKCIGMNRGNPFTGSDWSLAPFFRFSLAGQMDRFWRAMHSKLYYLLSLWTAKIISNLPQKKRQPEWLCYDFRRLRQSSTVVVSKVWSQMSLEECKSWTCIVLLGLRVKVQVKGLSIKD